MGLALAPLASPAPASAADTLLDLGLLPGGSWSLPGGMNAQGQVAGAADTLTATEQGERAFFWDEVQGMASLGTLGGRSTGHGINGAGTVVGVYRNAAFRNRAFVRDAAGMRELAPLAGGSASAAYAVSDGGLVVGESSLADGSFHAVLWDLTLGPAPAPQDLGALPGGTFTVAWAVSANGLVAGEGDAPDPASGDLMGRGFLWEPGVGMTAIPPFADGTFSVAHGVNSLGQVVGWGDRAGGARVHAFVWDRASGLRDLGTLDTVGPGIATYAYAINEAGQVVGDALRGDGSGRAFLWDPQAGMRELGPLPGGGFSAARAINGAGQVLGQSTSALGEDRAVRWQLNRPPAALGQALSTPRDTALGLTLGGTDPDGDSLVFEVVTGPGHGALSGTPPALTYTPSPGYAGPDAFTFRVGDGAAWSGPATVSLTVTAPTPTPEPAPPPPDPEEDPAGRMHGAGSVEAGGHRHHFEFRLQGGGTRPLSGRLEYHVEPGTPAGPRHGQRRPGGHFVATEITHGAFADDPGTSPGPRPPVAVDTATFGGRGRWNGAGGYTFRARAQDAGEPGPGRDRFELTIADPSGAVVAEVSGTLSAGNIQSRRPRRP